MLHTKNEGKKNRVTACFYRLNYFFYTEITGRLNFILSDFFFIYITFTYYFLR